MTKVFEHPDFTLVGNYQSILESEGIHTELRNSMMSSIMGEVPFVECFPELWVKEDGQCEQAAGILRELRRDAGANTFPEWTCAKCGTTVEGIFTQCWKCGTPAAV